MTGWTAVAPLVVWMFVYAIATVIFAVTVSADNDFYSHETNYIVLRQHVGVAFRAKRYIKPIVDAWRHVLIIKLPRPPGDVRTHRDIGCTHGRSYNVCRNTARVFNQIIDIQNGMINEANAIYKNILDAIPLRPRWKPRRKRTWWGLAEADELALLDQNMRDISEWTVKMTEDYIRTQSDIITISQLVNDRLKVLEDAFEHATLTLIDQFDDFYTEVRANTESVDLLVRILPRISTFVQAMNNLTDLHQALIRTINDHLDPFWIKPSQVYELMDNITDLTWEKHAGLQVAYERDVHSFYNNVGYVINTDRKNLYIQLRIPLTYHFAALIVFDVVRFPVHLSHDSTHMSILDTPYTAIAISEPLTHDDYILFHTLPEFDGHFLDMSKIPEAFIPRDQATCLSAIFDNDKENTMALCTFHVIPNSLKPSVLMLNPTTVLLTNITQLNLTCRSNHTLTQRVEGIQSVYKFGCNCSVTAGLDDGSVLAKIPRKFTSCEYKDENRSSLHSYVTNLPVLAEWFELDEINDIQMDTILDRIVHVNIPALNILHQNVSETMAVVHNLRYVLRLVTEAAKNDNVIFQSAADKELYHLKHLPKPEDIKKKSSSWDFDWGILDVFGTRSYINLIVALIAVLALILAIMSLRTARGATAAVVSLIPPVANALDATNNTRRPSHRVYDYFATTPSTTPEPKALTMPIEMYTATGVMINETSQTNQLTTVLNILTICLLICFLVAIAILYYKWHTRNTVSKFAILMQLGNSKIDEVVKVMTLKLNPALYTFTAIESKPKFKIEGKIRPYLYITWDGFKITALHTGEVMDLPQKVSLSLLQARKLRSIMEQSFWHVPLFSVNGIFQHATIQIMGADTMRTMSSQPIMKITEGQACIASAPEGVHLYPQLPSAPRDSFKIPI